MLSDAGAPADTSVGSPADPEVARMGTSSPNAVSGDASHALRTLIATTLTEEKAEDVVEIDLRGKSEMGDYMIVASGRSTRQVSALADKVIEKAKTEMGVLSRVEGKSAGDWVLIDTGDVIVHLFRPEVREFYQIEKMWMDPAGTPRA